MLLPPRYVANSASLAKSVESREGREIQVILASWQVEEDKEMQGLNPCFAALNDQLHDFTEIIHFEVESD